MKHFKIIPLLGLVLFSSAISAAPCETTKKNDMANVVITPVPGYEMITLDDAKQHLRIESDFDTDDVYIQGCIDDAVAWVVNVIDRGVLTDVTYTVTQTDPFSVSVRDWRTIALETVKIKREGETDFTDLPAENYKVLGVGCVAFTGLEGVYELQTEFSLTLSTIVRRACLLVLGDFYENREDRGDVNNRRAYNLIQPFRRY